jgi:DNA-binding NarL/FixJ family response regulator
MEGERCSILIVDDNQMLSDQVADALNSQSDLQAVATAQSVEQAAQGARRSNPRIALIDADLGGPGCHACVETVKRTAPDARVVVMGVASEGDEVVALVEAGASGFVMKDATMPELLATLRTVCGGAAVLPPRLADVVMGHIARRAVHHLVPPENRAVRLTWREREIIDLVSQGLSNKDMARRLNLTTYTIKSHVHNVFEKLSLHSRLELAAHAHQARAKSEHG